MTASDWSPRCYRLSVRVEADRGRGIAPAVKDLDGLAVARPRTVLLLVHGFNNSPADAESSYDDFLDNLKNTLLRGRIRPEAVAEFHWPGNVAMGPFRFMDTVGYPFDVPQAIGSARVLAEFLWSQPALRESHLVIVGHSLGCRLVLEALRRLPAALTGPLVDFVVLMAAAVPVIYAEPGGILETPRLPRDRLLKFCSTDDWVLWLAFPAGQTVAQDGGVMPVAIGRYGEPATLGNRQPTKNGHSEYWKDAETARAVAQIYDPTLTRSIRPHTLPRAGLPEANQCATRSIGGRNLPERATA